MLYSSLTDRFNLVFFLMVTDAADAWKLLLWRERDAIGAAAANIGFDLGPPPGARAAHQGPRGTLFY